MKPSGSRAYATARARAWKSRLLTREDVLPLLGADMQRAINLIGSPFQRLIEIYRTAIRYTPDAAPLLRAMLRLHEIENVKLLWRAVMRRRDPERVRKLWIPLGPLATVGEEMAEPSTPRELAEALADTAYKGIVNDILRAYPDDIGAAELAFDRWASRQLLDQARKLPRREALARELIELVVLERDAEIVRRGAKWFGLLSVAQAGTDSSGCATKKLRLCRRAFRGDPFALAAVIALILLAEAEVRGVRALIERQGDADLDAALARVIAGSQLAP